METRRLYYEDSHLAQFTAAVLDCSPAGDRWAVILDATAFYPEGGGQAGDTGSLNGIPVLDTREAGGQILHYCAAPLAPGTAAEGSVDYDSRFARMQQHSGEHIVSGLLHRYYGCSNVGFHMGSDRVTIDFDAVIPAADLPRIEAEANRAVWADTPVRIWTPSPEELASLEYRTKRPLPWPVRIVEFPGIDRCACCGTHVVRTGEIGLIKLLGAVPFRGGTRIEMACGSTALALLDAFYRQCLEVSHICSVPALRSGEGAAQLAAQLEDARSERIRYRRLWSSAVAGELKGAGNVLCLSPEPLDSSGLRELAEAVAAGCGGIAAVFSGDGSRWSYCLAYPGHELRELGKALNSALQGRGGGRDGFLQGSVSASDEEIRSFFRGQQFSC